MPFPASGIGMQQLHRGRAGRPNAIPPIGSQRELLILPVKSIARRRPSVSSWSFSRTFARWLFTMPERQIKPGKPHQAPGTLPNRLCLPDSEGPALMPDSVRVGQQLLALHHQRQGIEPMLAPAPIRTWDIFITRSSMRWVCREVRLEMHASSPMWTRSNSDRYVVAM